MTKSATRTPDTPTAAESTSGGQADAVAVALAVVLIAAACAIGEFLTAHSVPIHASAAPLAARWLPHLGPGTPLALAIAVLVVSRGSAYAATASWRRLLSVAYVTSLGWTFGLALVDGWQRGIAGRLTTQPEYLHDVGRVSDIGTMLRGFADHIATGPGEWTTHVAGHPPGALLVFVVLDRIGLGGGGPAGILCIVVGAVAPICVAVTLRSLGSEGTARAALPFLVLFPGAVWVGTSADGLFTGVAAAGLALIAMPGWWRAGIGGVLLGYTLYLSYGLVLISGLAAAILTLKSADRGRSLIAAGVGALTVAAAFTAAGFWWPTGYHQLIGRYYDGLGGIRPYSYWVWADVACLMISAGPVAAAGLRRAAVRVPRTAVTLLPVVAAGALLVADLTGLSKGETERIWLPYAIWLLAATALLEPRHRRAWLTLQAATALVVNHLLLTHW